MKVSIGSGDVAKLPCDLLVLPVFESDIKDEKTRLKALSAADKRLRGLLLAAAADEDFKGKSDTQLLFHTHGKIPAKRVLLAALGARAKFDPEVLRLALGRAVRTAQKVSARTVAVVLNETRELPSCVKAAAEGFLLGAYKFDRYKTKTDARKPPAVRDVRLFLPGDAEKTKELADAVQLGIAVSEATNFARDAVNEPANALTPTALAALATGLSTDGGLAVEILEREKLEELKMGLFLGVTQGSAQPPKLIHLTYQPASEEDRKKAPLALVGKAITFDSGGLSIKPAEGMGDMKGDMAGSAAVLGAMRVIGKLKPPFPVHAFIGACENMPGGRAYRPGDVLKSRLGKTVEIVNTDAEGRLVLGDVLAYAAELGPAAIIELSTLTGACVVALGHYITGAFSEADATVWAVLEAARAAGEELWRMPLTEHQRDAIKSDVADLKNSGERWGSALSAALFLKEFTGKVPYVHLDIAGPSQSPKERGYYAKGATGHGVRTLVEFVRGRMHAGLAGCEEKSE